MDEEELSRRTSYGIIGFAGTVACPTIAWFLLPLKPELEQLSLAIRIGFLVGAELVCAMGVLFFLLLVRAIVRSPRLDKAIDKNFRKLVAVTAVAVAVPPLFMLVSSLVQAGQ